MQRRKGLVLRAMMGMFDDMRTVHSHLVPLAKYVTASCVAGLTCLHWKRLCYRALNPENIVFDSHGRIKLCDFGITTFVGPREKTKTLCGVPEYFAPEMLLNNGHDQAVD